MTARYLKSFAVIGLALFATAAASAQPSIVAGGVLNAASFAKNAQGQGTPVAPGSLVAIFGNNLSVTQADADTVPFGVQLGGVSVTFGGIPGRMRDDVPSAGIVNVELPYGLTPGTTVNAVVTVNNVPSAPAPVQIVAQAPGIFSVPPGAGYAIFVNLNTNSKNYLKLAAPTNANLGLATAPIERSTSSTPSFAYFYATGLGVMTPPVGDGATGLDGVTHQVPNYPTVTLGGVPLTVLYAGVSGFPGVYQVNVQIPANVPTGDSIDMQMTSADGTQISPAGVVHVAVQ